MADYEDLATECQNALSSTFLVDLTNHDGTGTSINTVVLYSATKAAIGAFEHATRVTFDTTSYDHLHFGVDLTRLILLMRMNHASAEYKKEYNDVIAGLEEDRGKSMFNSQFYGFGSNTTGSFDDSDWDDFR